MDSVWGMHMASGASLGNELFRSARQLRVTRAVTF
jgi:hypothetical protein